MTAGDLTEIGEKGINLSGGQKARLSLARAVYKRPEVILMDDPISALDTTTRKKIFDQVFQGILKDSTRILVTHAVDFIHLADKVVIMNEGTVIAQGSPKELVDHPYMKQVHEIHTANKEEVQEMDMDEVPLNRHETISDAETVSSEEVSEEQVKLSDQDISVKLIALSGSERGLDKETEEIVGKLLIDEKDENVNADTTTWNKLYKMIGGAVTLGTIGMTTLVFKYFEVYKQSVTQEWSNASPE